MKYIFSLLLIAVFHFAYSQINYPGNPPGKAKATKSSNEISLENNAVKMVFQIKGDHIRPLSFMDKANHHTLNLLPLNWFELNMQGGKVMSDKDFHFLNKPIIKSIAIQKRSARFSDHLPGKMIEASFVNPSTGLSIKWEAILRDGSNYIKQKWAFHTKDSSSIIRYTMLEVTAGATIQEGTVDGSPLVSKEMFFALEHPMSKNEISKEKAVSYLPWQNALQHSDSLISMG
ncbi:MAG TPA: hypothetical protein VMU83_02260 [Hanamia sp.]|nr:hypothetical protein [Hanamia sp.]